LKKLVVIARRALLVFGTALAVERFISGFEVISKLAIFDAAW
jgi:hypothetical protein